MNYYNLLSILFNYLCLTFKYLVNEVSYLPIPTKSGPLNGAKIIGFKSFINLCVPKGGEFLLDNLSSKVIMSSFENSINT